MVRCVRKIRNRNNIITHYVLFDGNKQVIMDSDTVKAKIKAKQLSVQNLTLTSDNRLIEKIDNGKDGVL